VCSLHNDPKIIYWQSPLEWRRLCPQWDDRAGKAWENLVSPAGRLPLDGFDPFPWKHHQRDALFAVGQLELEIAESVKGVVNQLGGDFYETGIRFASICCICEAEVTQKVTDAVEVFAPRYKQAAYSGMLQAIRAEITESIAYVNAALASELLPDLGAHLATELGVDSPKEAWGNFKADLKRRLDSAELLSQTFVKETAGTQKDKQ
jgi:hypothetical protein